MERLNKEQKAAEAKSSEEFERILQKTLAEAKIAGLEMVETCTKESKAEILKLNEKTNKVATESASA